MKKNIDSKFVLKVLADETLSKTVNHMKKIPTDLMILRSLLSSTRETIQSYQTRFKYAVGPIEKLKQFASRVKKKWLFGYKGARILYST